MTSPACAPNLGSASRWAAWGRASELEKLITSTFTVESGAVIFDNLAEGEVIASPVLANLLTNPMWSSRILGKSGVGVWPNDRLWMATGNNLRVGGDIASRAVCVRLKPAAPHPEGRTGFQIPDLQGWIKDPGHRAELLWRLLVLVADWVAAGHPATPVRRRCGGSPPGPTAPGDSWPTTASPGS